MKYSVRNLAIYKSLRWSFFFRFLRSRFHKEFPKKNAWNCIQNLSNCHKMDYLWCFRHRGCNRHHQDYQPFFRSGNPNLNLHLWLESWGGGRSNGFFLYRHSDKMTLVISYNCMPQKSTTPPLHEVGKKQFSIQSPVLHLPNHWFESCKQCCSDGAQCHGQVHRAP